MAEQKESKCHLRLRMMEVHYLQARNLLAEARDGVFLMGTCGWARPDGLMENESVICVHTLAGSLIHSDGEAASALPASECGQEKGRCSWPVIIYNAQKGDEWAASQAKRLFGGQELILAVAINGDGEVYGHALLRSGWNLIDSVMVVGADIHIWTSNHDGNEGGDSERTKRFEQSFGSKTQRILSNLRIGVVGISGTGSPVAEMLYRLGVGDLVLVDNDRVETKNLGRIYNSSTHDADCGRLKVDVIGDAFERNGLPTRVRRIAGTTRDPKVIAELAQCDILFGCMDTESGRATLNRLATFYLIPYFDLGVNLKADGLGGISVVCGAVHYLRPGGSSLLSRKAILPENIEAEDLQRANFEMYTQQVKEKYIKGVVEERPAVITVNTLIASFALNDFLARLHPYRRSLNTEIGCIRVDLREPVIYHEGDGEPDEGLARWTGSGDIEPLLGMPAYTKKYA